MSSSNNNNNDFQTINQYFINKQYKNSYNLLKLLLYNNNKTFINYSKIKPTTTTIMTTMGKVIGTMLTPESNRSLATIVVARDISLVSVHLPCRRRIRHSKQRRKNLQSQNKTRAVMDLGESQRIWKWRPHLPLKRSLNHLGQL